MEQAKDYQKKWRAENKEKIKAYKKQYRQENKDKIASYRKEYYEENKEKVKAQAKKWAEENKENRTAIVNKWAKANKDKMSAYQKEWSKENKEKIAVKRKEWDQKNRGLCRSYCAKRRAAVMQRTPLWADLDAIKQFYADCPEGMEVDHRYALQGKEVSGLHVLENLQYLTPFENRSKSNKFLEDRKNGTN